MQRDKLAPESPVLNKRFLMLLLKVLFIGCEVEATDVGVAW